MNAVSGVALFPVFIVGVLFISLLLGLALVCWTIVRIVQGGGRHQRHVHDDESRLMQEIYQGLSRMELRVETLETLLLERDGKGKES